MIPYLGDVSLYKVFNILAGVSISAFLFLRYKKYIDALELDETKHPIVLSLVQIALICIVFFGLFSVLNPLFAKWFTKGNANYFGNMIAWLIATIAVPYIFGVSPLRAADVLSPVLPLSLFIAKIACFCHGCCSGFEMPGSFYYNNYTNRYEFPVQMLEALVALGLFSFIRAYEKKNKLPGSVFPIYLTAYSISRFCTEFFRADLPNVLGPLDAYQILSLIFALNGYVLFVLLRNYGDKIEMMLCRNSQKKNRLGK